jgi:beta-glucanase (GH16 family)
MKNRFYIFMLLSAVVILCPVKRASAQWQLVWSDEFNGSIGPDWVFETGTGDWGWGNNEQQFYRAENISVVNGALRIQARRENYGGMNYTSGRMKTQGRRSFQYGKIEARISMPSFMGVWPAFWMLGTNISQVGWPACGEIDIMEHINTGGEIHGTMHWDDGGQHASYGGVTSTGITSYHVYSIEWDPQYIRWFVDGNKFHEALIEGGVNSTNELHNSFFLLLNMAIGGEWPGYNIDNNAFPADMLVDYVRVYEASGSEGNITVRARGTSGSESVQLRVNNNVVSTWTMSAGYQNYTASGSGTVSVHFTNDASGRDVQVDYVQIDGVTYQAENQTTNTGVYQNGSCGGSNSEWLHCNGYIQIGSGSGGSTIRIEAENYANMLGVQTENCSEGGQNVGWIDAGDWIVWNANILSSGIHTIEYRVASLNGGGVIQFEKAGGTPVYGTLNVPGTGGWQNWTTVKHTVNLSAGQQQVAIYAPSGGYNINWLQITAGYKSAEFEEISEDKPDVWIYPNPAGEYLYINGLEEQARLGVYNISGVKLYETSGDELNTGTLEKGVYILKITTPERTTTHLFNKN